MSRTFHASVLIADDCTQIHAGTLSWKLRGGMGMHKPMSNDITEHILHTVELARPIVAAINRHDRDLASQVRRALSSVGLNIAEGLGTRSGNARLRFETALGSLRETRAGIRIAVAWGYVAPSVVAELLASLDALGGRVFGMWRR